MQVTPDIDITLNHCEVYLPAQRLSVEECLCTERERQPMTSLAAHWRDTLIEPSHLMHFMNGQMAPASNEASVADLRSRLADHATAASPLYRAEGETSSDMAVRVCRQMTGKHPQTPSEAGVLIHAQATMNEVPTSSIPCRLQHELKMPNAIPFGISQKAGNSVFAALQVASSMMTAEAALDSIILCASDKFVEPYPRLLPGDVLVNDSAACMVLKKGGPGLRLLAVDLQDFPELWTCSGYPGEDEAEGTRLMVCRAKAMVVELLERLGISPAQVSLFVPLNMATQTADSLAVSCGLEAGSLYRGEFYDAGSFANPELMIKLDSILREYDLAKGSFLVAISFGYGTSIGCTVLTV